MRTLLILLLLIPFVLNNKLKSYLRSYALQIASDYIKVAKGKYGDYLVDTNGIALYGFGLDKDGKSKCYQDCAIVWAPLLQPRLNVKTGAGIDEHLLGTTQRADGSLQITYNNWPLYSYILDSKPGLTNGQLVEGSGGIWYLMSPKGKFIEKKDQASAGGADYNISLVYPPEYEYPATNNTPTAAPITEYPSTMSNTTTSSNYSEIDNTTTTINEYPPTMNNTGIMNETAISELPTYMNITPAMLEEKPTDMNNTSIPEIPAYMNNTPTAAPINEFTTIMNNTTINENPTGMNNITEIVVPVAAFEPGVYMNNTNATVEPLENLTSINEVTEYPSDNMNYTPRSAEYHPIYNTSIIEEETNTSNPSVAMNYIWEDHLHPYNLSDSVGEGEDNMTYPENGQNLTNYTSNSHQGPFVLKARKLGDDKYLTDSSGFSLYAYTSDLQSGKSYCTMECARYWLPAYISSGINLRDYIDPKLDKSKVSTFMRHDGRNQIVYNGWPLYYFPLDKRAGDTSGQGLESFTGDWYLVNTDGNLLKENEISDNQ